ncbi:MAG: hypothetical protein CMH13_11080 [Martelella sp.]|uniref:hypothetical protein n=1 Tax=unclassified Martelella TaxID=2629616 RepID=UPI000C5429C2|nr:hypothetical protein [Martelella sp.]MAU21062.1 hypothetical protein [Martelella sp.]|tara:strand:- start:6877 stop:7137 length:261 start_codon:yes stop_codon:yes gene_type:complete
MTEPKMVSPLTVMIMLACRSTVDPAHLLGNSVWNSKAAFEARSNLEAVNLLEEHIEGWRITDRGNAWIDRILATPLPVAVWTVPDD